ncbi:signal peptide protein [Cryptosporidium sp. chipmunk genotype I]|uniref:signal peptide protein n=1 Tax=Cryptosporidium sp. chipmunk genotype I TaxID=1280935 RepID=UPI003519EF48|nr:signal peptide protein [Cryptosporidium sp. chipmunk genotype I]
MKYIKSIFYLIFINLSLCLINSSDLFASCESPNEPEEAIASTSTAPGISSVAFDEVDLAVYSSSGEKISEDNLEKELYELFQTTEGDQIVQISRSSSSSENNSDNEDETEGRSSSEARSLKRMRYTYSYGSPGEGTSSGRDFHSSYYEMPQGFAEAFDTFLKENTLELIILELERTIFSSSSLYFTSIWRDRNKLSGKIIFLIPLLEFWGNKDHRKNLPIKEIMIRYFQFTKKQYRSTILSDYGGFQRTNYWMMRNFNNNIDKLKCSDPKRSLAVIILLFELNFKLLSSAYLFYLLVCSFKELEGLEFEQSFKLLKSNKKRIASKISAVGGDNVKKFLKEMKNNIYSMSELKIKKYKKPIQFPLIMNKINVRNFGLRFCLSLLELYLINTSVFSMTNLIFFFGSRLSSAAEVFLAYDIINTLKNIRRELFDIIVTIIFDREILGFIARRIMALHNLDISNLRSRFGECIGIKNRYRELSGLIQITDYQRAALLKQESKKKRKKR